jgi:hypothetical protein
MIMLWAENIRKFSFETGFDPGMLLDKPGRRVPEGHGAGSGVGPRPHCLPPTVPGAPLRGMLGS